MFVLRFIYSFVYYFVAALAASESARPDSKSKSSAQNRSKAAFTELTATQVSSSSDVTSLQILNF
jgi:hypothetical protein